MIPRKEAKGKTPKASFLYGKIISCTGAIHKEQRWPKDLQRFSTIAPDGNGAETHTFSRG